LIDMRFDQAVSTRDALIRLNYSKADDELSRSHAERVARVLGADGPIIVDSPTPTSLSIRRAQDQDGAAEFLPLAYKKQQLRAAITRILDGTPSAAQEAAASPRDARPEATLEPAEDATGDSPRSPPPEPLPVSHRRAWALGVGGFLSIAGAAALGTSAVLYRARRRAGTNLRWAPTSQERLAVWHDSKLGPVLAGSLGAGALAVGTVILGGYLEPDEHVWLPTSAAALGATALIWGATSLAKAPDCDERPSGEAACVETATKRDRGATLLFASGPLLSFSLGQFVRWMRPPLATNVQAAVSPGHYGIRVQTVF
jgi:hypothetical protein